MSKYNELNLDDIIQNWASKYLSTDVENVNTSRYKYDIDLSRVKFIHEEPIYATKGSQNDTMKSHILYVNTVRNDTAVQENISLKAERHTMSVAKFNLAHALVCGSATMLTLVNLPAEVPGTVGFDSELHISNISSQEFREKLTWSIDDKMKVPANRTLKTTVFVQEKTYEANFSVTTHIKGNVYCKVTDPVCHNEIKLSQEGNIVEILQEYAGDMDGLSFAHNRAKFESTGYCSFRFGIQKDVNIEYQ